MSVGATTSKLDGLKPLELGRLIRYGLAASSAGGGLIHLAAARDHSSKALEAALFVGAAVGQLVWTGLILRRASRWLLGLGGIFSAVLIACWVLSRTTGLPLLGGEVEPLGFKDGIAVLLEVGVIVGASLLALLPAEARTLIVPAGRLASYTALVSVAALTVIAMAFAPGHAVGGHTEAELASANHGQTGHAEDAATAHGDVAHADAADAHTSADAPHEAMSAHEPGTAELAGPDGHGGADDHGSGPGATELAHGGHGGSAVQVASVGSAADGHAAHAANGSKDHSTSTDHSAHGSMAPGGQEPGTDHGGDHGTSEPGGQEPGADHGGDHGDGGQEDDKPARTGLFGWLIGFVEDLR